MAEIDDDAELGAAHDEGAPRVGQAGPGVRRGREAKGHAVAERAGPAPDQPDRAHAGRVPGVERREARVDRLGALEVQDHRQGAVRVAAVQCGGVRDDGHRAVAGRRQRVGAPDGARGERRGLGMVDRAGVGHVRQRPGGPRVVRRGRVDREQCAAEPPGTSAGQVDLAVGQPGEELGGVAVAGLELAQHVVVAVEDDGHAWSRSIHLCTVTGSHVSSRASRSSRPSPTASSVRVSGRRKRSCTAWSRKATSGR